MRLLVLAAVLAAVFPVHVPAQQINRAFSSLVVNGDPIGGIGAGPLSVSGFTDSPMSINVRGGANSPVVIIYGPLSIGALSFSDADTQFQIDIGMTGRSYANQILVNGYADPSAFTDLTALYSVDAVMPACAPNPEGFTLCNTVSSFSRSVQAVTVDPTAGPLGVRSTAATTVNFTNGYREYTTQIGSGGNAKVVFLDGFTFPFYGATYDSRPGSAAVSSCFIYADGFITFGANPPVGFASPQLGHARTGPRKIFNWFTDLINVNTYGRKAYSQQFVDVDGFKKIKIVHSRYSEFGDNSGPHGADATISESGDIVMNVHVYQASGTINTMIGVSPGATAPVGTNIGIGATPFGRDLSADMAVPGGTQLGPFNEAVELFDTGFGTPCINCVDLIGLGILQGGMKFNRIPGVGFLLTL